MKIILIGVPGSGKSTQGNLMSEQLNLPYLSAGDIFRNIAKEDSERGKSFRKTMEAGKLLPDGLTVEIIENYLSSPEYSNGYILDGFPRSTVQAELFNHKVDRVIFIDLDDREALWRIALRTDERNDQQAGTVVNRLKVFHETTNPVVEHYRGKGILADIDGSGTVEQVNDEILRYFGKKREHGKAVDWKPEKPIIFALTGLCGSGKSSASAYFSGLGMPVIHFGSRITEEVQKRNLEMNVQGNEQVRKEFRDEHGMSALAKLSSDIIKEGLKEHNRVVIDDMHSFEEYEFLSTEMIDAKVVLIDIWAHASDRYNRVKNRSDRPGYCNRERDLSEIVKDNMGTTIAMADYVVKNDGSVEDLHRALGRIYKKEYFDLS